MECGVLRELACASVGWGQHPLLASPRQEVTESEDAAAGQMHSPFHLVSVPIPAAICHLLPLTPLFLFLAILPPLSLALKGEVDAATAGGWQAHKYFGVLWCAAAELQQQLYQVNYSAAVWEGRRKGVVNMGAAFEGNSSKGHNK
ncbi:unnamed protein product [Closterium sp. Naga37s-1]|nr:unnamed protein product [Closterium sp. Naga37s-1]